jgi:RNA polymerase sigma-70 factor (ECF subfamily)
MDEMDVLADRFEEHRPRLRAVAYRMLGSTSEADDAVQDAWLRPSRADASGVENLGGWLTTVVARVCRNMLRSRNTRREAFRGAETVAQQARIGALPGAELHAALVMHAALVNGAAGVVVTVKGRPFAVMGFTVADGRIVEIDAIVDSERVGRITAAVLGRPREVALVSVG